jgi:SAM-dependent methyltransferase
MKCRHCGEPLTLQMVDLGASPPSNAFHATAEEKQESYRLRVLVCTECWLAQTDIDLFKLDHDKLFAADYPYFSSTSKGWVEHARDFVERITKQLALGTDSLTIEVGANDGYLLQWVKTPCFGVEPTRTGDKAKAKGIEIYPQFFGEQWAKNAATYRGKADLMIANNVLAHVPDINDFVRGFTALLKPEGMAVFEFPHLLNLVQKNQFDTIYHEHYSYLSLTAVQRIFAANGLEVFGVEKLHTHGGSLRVYAGHPGAHKIADRVAFVLLEEEREGMKTESFYKGFQRAADKVKNDLVSFLLTAKSLGLEVAAFGAAAKGNTLLNYAGIKADLLPYVVDDTPSKQGQFLPGSGIPVQAEFTSKPDYVLVLPWNFRAEITAKLSRVRDWGGRFVFAVPALEVA